MFRAPENAAVGWVYGVFCFVSVLNTVRPPTVVAISCLHVTYWKNTTSIEELYVLTTVPEAGAAWTHAARDHATWTDAARAVAAAIMEQKR